MKENINKVRFLLYPIVLCAMIFATFEYANISVFAATCCTYGVDCGGKGRVPTLKCCTPGLGEAPCSQSQTNYCRESCV
jgi:hypothetical protein